MQRLDQTLERFLRTGEGAFESLALEIFKHQFDLNGPYRAYCKTLKCTPDQVKRWEDIPAVPVKAFKSDDLCTFNPALAAAIFHSSGTTENRPSRHFIKDLSFYEASLRFSFEREMLHDNAALPFMVLTPPPSEAPHSSLAWMMDVVMRKWGKAGSGYFIQRGRLNDFYLSLRLSRHAAEGQPVALLGTTIGFVAFFEFLNERQKTIPLPAGSRLLDTGGTKSLKRDISRSSFVEAAKEFFDIEPVNCVSEYGMCELSSQMYARGKMLRYAGPPWLRTLVIDPNTNEPAPDGVVGLLRHFDLANLDSVLALQTEDLGRKDAQGIELLGRASDAEIRGCSLQADSLLRNG